MGLKRTDEFRQDAVRIALTSGLTRKQIASDLGVGMSTLNKWITAQRDTDVVSKEDLSLAKVTDRLRREIRLLKEEKEILKRATQFFAGLKQWDLGSSKNTGAAFPPIAFAMSLALARAVCGPSTAVLPVANGGLISSLRRTSKNNFASAWAVLVGHL